MAEEIWGIRFKQAQIGGRLTWDKWNSGGTGAASPVRSPSGIPAGQRVVSPLESRF